MITVQKTYVYAILFLLVFSKLNAQLCLKTNYYQPLGELGFVMKPTINYQIGFRSDFKEDSRWRVNVDVSFINFKPRLEKFPSYTISNIGDAGNITNLKDIAFFPGFTTYNKYNLYYVTFQGDFAFIKTDRFHGYINLGISGGYAVVEYVKETSLLDYEDYEGGGYYYGLRPMIGLEYKLSDRLRILCSANKNYFVVSDPAFGAVSNEFGIGLNYMFNPNH